MIWFNNLIAKILPYFPKPFVGIFARQYIAGETLEDAVREVKNLNAQGICATIDLLGEEKKVKEDALKAVEVYLQVLNVIAQEKLDANISVKPTHMGLKLDKEFCYQNIKRLVEAAKQINNFVRIDMEDSSCTDDTIDIYLRLKQEYDNVGTVFQSYLRRLVGDLNRVIPHKANLRLCKGAYYWEKREVVYKDGEIVNDSFRYALEKLLSNGCYVGIATHDERLVWEGIKLVDKLHLKRDDYEFQMLLGVDPQLRRIIVDAGHRLRVYVPFGKEWFAYSIRRLRENPKMVNYILKNTVFRIFGKRQ
ncbi:MAG: proline dehydrogenase family protein [candidate division KSB1 bacterium]|nr:proline dehydrogenase family protein [candidate division KSB1 bacterium]MDZ7334195.1 proline dehydrogenase family protein [candidate division KSB1 bacterium]MDZ7357476.1 proline dehydrogenase family protein [candidate division KSB1 bacterium]MDZ7400888.1 proline dehydrogenase family protein [candidate division KSB1 bacterium]